MTDVTPQPAAEFGVEDGPRQQTPPPSLARSSAARFAADAAGLVFGLLSGVITARGLGPTGKGLFSSLTMISGIVLWICSMGLGDAAVVMVGQGRASVQKALSLTITAALALSLLGAVMLWGAAILAFKNDWADVRTAALIACAALPVSVLGLNLGFLLAAQERIAAQSAVAAVTAVLTSIGLVLFVGVIPLSVAGGALANAVGAGGGMAFAAILLRRAGLSFRPAFDASYLITALRYGVSMALSYVVTLMFLRVDVLLVYGLAGAGQAGLYSVSLALSALVGMLPIAISVATFPRLAALGDRDADELTAQACRYGVAGALTGAVVLLVAVPFVLPLLFGRAFAPAVGPTLILLVSGVLWSTQWILSRAAAARGRPGLLVGSFVLGLAVMGGLDYLLIPRWGLTGAALSAVAGPVAGLAMCLVSYQRSSSYSLPIRALLPRPDDFRYALRQSRSLLPSPRRVSTSVRSRKGASARR